MKLSTSAAVSSFCALHWCMVSQIQLDNQFGDWNGVDHAARHLTDSPFVKTAAYQQPRLVVSCTSNSQTEVGSG